MSSDEVELGSNPGAKIGPASPASGPMASEAAAGAAPVAAASPQSSAEIAAAIASGQLDPAAAQSLLIDQIARERLPAGASPEAIAAFAAELSNLLDGDPTLRALLS